MNDCYLHLVVASIHEWTESQCIVDLSIFSCPDQVITLISAEVDSLDVFSYNLGES